MTNVYRPAYTEDTYDEINAELQRLSAIDAEDRAAEEGGNTNRTLIGSGEDCVYVLFGGNYRGIH